MSPTIACWAYRDCELGRAQSLPRKAKYNLHNTRIWTCISKSILTRRNKMASKKSTYSNLDYPLHATYIKAAMLEAKENAMSASISTDEDRAIKIEVADGSRYAHQRVTLDYSEGVFFDTATGSSRPRLNGALVSVLFEALGSPGDKVILNFTNAVPSAINCSFSVGSSCLFLLVVMA